MGELHLAERDAQPTSRRKNKEKEKKKISSSETAIANRSAAEEKGAGKGEELQDRSIRLLATQEEKDLSFPFLCLQKDEEGGSWWRRRGDRF